MLHVPTRNQWLREVYDASPHIARTICCDPERWKMVVDVWVGILYFRSFDMGANTWQ